MKRFLVVLLGAILNIAGVWLWRHWTDLGGNNTDAMVVGQAGAVVILMILGSYLMVFGWKWPPWYVSRRED